MNVQNMELFTQLVGFDIAMLISAKGICVDRLDGTRSKLAEKIFTKYKKNTKIQYSVLIINVIVILLSYGFEAYVQSGEENNFIIVISNFADLIINNIIYLIILTMVTILFMLFVYRAVQIKSDIDGHRHLNADEIDKEYINFSKSSCIDGHSTLLLIAGDLSFFGDIPDIKNINGEKKKKKCRELLSENSLKNYCGKKCPSNIGECRCIQKSEQFAQLFDLKSRGIKLNIICQKPRDEIDIQYKRRLGRLVKIFSSNIEIRFLPKDTLGNKICVLGRIKVNGGIEELFWHWKDPNTPGTYTVPETKKADSSENKTLIYLLGTMLWNSADKMDEYMIKECICEYNKAIEENVKKNVKATAEESIREDLEENDKENV